MPCFRSDLRQASCWRATSLVRAHAGGGRMPGHLEALAGIGDVCPFDPQNGEVLIEIVADQEILSVRREHYRLRQSADFQFLDLGNLLVVDAKHGNKAVAMVEVGGLVVGTRQNGRGGDVSLGADSQALRAVADHYTIDDPRRLRFKIDHADGVDAAVRGARTAVIRGQRNLAAGRNSNVVGIGSSVLVGVTLSPATSSTVSLWAGNLTAKARFPSGVKVTCETLSPIGTVSISLTSVPLIDSTLMDFSSRLATSARLPAGLMLRPEGCFPNRERGHGL